MGYKYLPPSKRGGDARADPAVQETEALKRAQQWFGRLVSLPRSRESARAGWRSGVVVRSGGSNLRGVWRFSKPLALASSLFLGRLEPGFSRLRARDAGASKRASIDPSCNTDQGV